jgi:hypothetical protein
MLGGFNMVGDRNPCRPMIFNHPNFRDPRQRCVSFVTHAMPKRPAKPRWELDNLRLNFFVERRICPQVTEFKLFDFSLWHASPCATQLRDSLNDVFRSLYGNTYSISTLHF